MGRVEKTLVNVITREVEGGPLTWQGPLPRPSLVAEALLQLANNYAQVPPVGQEAFLTFVEWWAASGVAGLVPRGSAHCPFGFLKRADEGPVESMKGRFRNEQVMKVVVPCELVLLEEKPLPLQEEYAVQILRVLSHCLFVGLWRDKAQTALQALLYRAESDVMPRTLMMARALSHKFFSSPPPQPAQ